MERTRIQKCRSIPIWQSVLLIVFLIFLLLFGKDWKRAGAAPPGKETPKEMPVNAELDSSASLDEMLLAEEEQIDKDLSQDGGVITDKTKKNKVTLTKREGTFNWNTSDEIVAQHFAEILLLKHERFKEKLDIREYDYSTRITDENNKEEIYKLWINFEAENEIIVEDESGAQWNISVRDSNDLRIMIQRNGE